MIKINRTILDLGKMLETLNYDKTLEIYNTLLESHDEFMSTKVEYELSFNTTGDGKEQLALIDEQLLYLNTNIQTVKTCLQYYETRVFEKSPKLGTIGNICNN